MWINRDDLKRETWVLGRFQDEPNTTQWYDFGWQIGQRSLVRCALMVLLADYCVRQDLDPLEYEIEAYDPHGQRVDPAWTGYEYETHVAREDRRHLVFLVKPVKES